ncbi:MAG: DUF2190 family protein [Betaproteobacteria bacterium]|nr:DUF2190 family protein [Betaproteobacteria bacterium]
MLNPLLTKAFTAGAAVAQNRIVKMGAADGAVIVAAAVSDKPIGVSVASIDAASGGRVDVVLAGVYEVKAGGTITRGDPITSDATGQAVTAAPAAGTNNGIIGRALQSAVSGDMVDVLICPSSFQG